jgi:glycerol-3-phosphate acyltransferase PlsY
MVSFGVLVGTAVGVAVTIPFVVTGLYSPWVLVYAALVAGLIVVRHADNIQRLLAGTERKIGQAAQPLA